MEYIFIQLLFASADSVEARDGKLKFCTTELTYKLDCAYECLRIWYYVMSVERVCSICFRVYKLSATMRTVAIVPTLDGHTHFTII